ncbi:Mitochondrial carrier domain-containing protein [Rozella allomycis CSF55]|uniref:Mitochondrial carrier domain-containing protein n=1 Tax=Rozella allomycis (strain CSF55) TaxID=988480 RepID=A0A075AXG2_ROZAC|nr:Mitochondrial carrier domain-containing protein [Rozella allomycis CSF55]|eukprot:EPZ34834.1 Mitochondrial carrier domain-containing protein [Rozella allomycis CSF55]
MHVSIDNNDSTSKLILLKELSAGCISCGIASAVTNPLDVIKTRMQSMKHSLQHASSTSFFSTSKLIYSEQGMWRGLVVPGMTAALLRETMYSSLRFGLYTKVKKAIEKSHLPPLFSKMISGMTTGAIGSAIASPTDLVKIRMQIESGTIDQLTGRYVNGMRTSHFPSYKNTFHAFYVIVKEEGGLYIGATATIARASLLTGGQLAAYDQSKTILKQKYGFQEGFGLHVLCSIVSSFSAATFCAPADIMKTKMMGSYGYDSTYHQETKSFWSCFRMIYTSEGIRGLYRGWSASFLRLAPHFILSMPLYEKVRVLVGLDNL